MQSLIAEDHGALGEGLAACLRSVGHRVELVSDGTAALAALGRRRFDLLVLDFGLPRTSGPQVLREVRRRTQHLPVLLISALDDADDRLADQGLAIDAFLAKPFSLYAFERCVARLLEPAAAPEHERLTFGTLSFDVEAGDIRIADQPLGLQADECAVLRILLHEAGTPLTREELSQRLAARVDAPTIDRCVARLRARLGPHALDIAELRGLGLCLTRAVTQRR